MRTHQLADFKFRLIGLALVGLILFGDPDMWCLY